MYALLLVNQYFYIKLFIYNFKLTKVSFTTYIKLFINYLKLFIYSSNLCE